MEVSCESTFLITPIRYEMHFFHRSQSLFFTKLAKVSYPQKLIHKILQFFDLTKFCAGKVMKRPRLPLINTSLFSTTKNT